MKTLEINDPICLQAINALDNGRLDELRTLIDQYPILLSNRIIIPDQEGYFKNPYLIWFVADNPIRNPKLPVNIVAILHFLIEAVKIKATDTFFEQINYTLALVVTGRVPRECGVQIALMNALIDAGAVAEGIMSAIAHGNIEAASHLIDRGDKLTLAAALILDRKADIDRLLIDGDVAEKETALAVAAFYGNSDVVEYLLHTGIDPNYYPSRRSRFPFACNSITSGRLW